jgi:hypothetical protein
MQPTPLVRLESDSAVHMVGLGPGQHQAYWPRPLSKRPLDGRTEPMTGIAALGPLPYLPSPT